MHKKLLNQCNITFDYLKNTENGQKLLKEMIGKILNIDVTDITILKHKIELISQDEEEIYNYLCLISSSTKQRKEILEKCNNQLFIEFDKNIKEN